MDGVCWMVVVLLILIFMDSLLGYREKRDLVCRLFMERSADMQIFVDSILVIRELFERVDRIGRMLGDFVPREFGWYNGGVYVFNGKFYEPLSYENLKYGVDDFLYNLKVGAKDRVEKFLYAYVQRIKDRAREHELHPRMSLMCFQNCVVDMNNLIPKPHGVDFDVVKMYDFKYDRREIFNCKTWNKFIGEKYLVGESNDGVLPEKQKRRILQMFLGACLMDRSYISFEYFMILQGTGANGKSVISRVLAGMFGSNEMLNIKLSSFSRSGDEGLRAVESMRGKRLLHCTESTRSDFKDMSILKAISSGEPLASRALKENIKMLQRPPLLICNSNYRWKLDDFVNREDPNDISVQRRAVIINFNKSIPLEDRDTRLTEKMSKEYAGIFAWLVKGLVELKKNGWRLPETTDGKVDMALMRIRSSVVGINGKKVDGSVSEWVKLMTMIPVCEEEKEDGELKKRQSNELYALYERFCERVGADSVSTKKFGGDLITMGFKRIRGDGSTYVFRVKDADISRKFDAYVPDITRDAESSIFEGFAYTDEDFINEKDIQEVEGEEES